MVDIELVSRKTWKTVIIDSHYPLRRGGQPSLASVAGRVSQTAFAAGGKRDDAPGDNQAIGRLCL